VVISDTETATAVPRLSITPQLMLPRETTPKRLSAIPRPLITTPPRHQSTTLQHSLLQLITSRLPNTTPPRHRSTTPLHIMGKYSVTSSFNMPTAKCTNYLLSSRMKGERIQQAIGHLRYGNRNCLALFVINFILRRITSFKWR
jgi:hypothetical protein